MYIKQLPMTLEQVVSRGSQMEQFEDIQDETKAKFIIKLVSLYNRQLERQK